MLILIAISVACWYLFGGKTAAWLLLMGAVLIAIAHL